MLEHAVTIEQRPSNPFTTGSTQMLDDQGLYRMQAWPRPCGSEKEVFNVKGDAAYSFPVKGNHKKARQT